LFALGLLGVLAVANYVMFRAEIREGEASAAIQQVSGRHRLLFQQCVILAEEFVLTTDAELRREYHDRLSQLVNDLESMHYRLIEFDTPRNALEELPGQDSPTTAQSKVQHIYFDSPWLLDTEVRNYIAQLHALMSSEPGELSLGNPHFRYLRNVALSDRVNGALDAVVSAYQRQSETKTRQLRQAAYWSFLGTCLVLAFTGVFVFRPMARRVRQEMDAMEDLNQTLEHRVSERTALAEQHARELEESEAALRNQTRILWSILESMGDGVVVADRESDFQLMNRAARRMLNVDEDSHPDVRAENWTEAFGVRIYRPDQVTPYPHEDLPLIQAINGRAVTRADLPLVRHGSGQFDLGPARQR
jgi:PAS domain-containing protein